MTMLTATLWMATAIVLTSGGCHAAFGAAKIVENAASLSQEIDAYFKKPDRLQSAVSQSFREFQVAMEPWLDNYHCSRWELSPIIKLSQELGEAEMVASQAATQVSSKLRAWVKGQLRRCSEVVVRENSGLFDSLGKVRQLGQFARANGVSKQDMINLLRKYYKPSKPILFDMDHKKRSRTEFDAVFNKELARPCKSILLAGEDVNTFILLIDGISFDSETAYKKTFDEYREALRMCEMLETEGMDRMRAKLFNEIK